MSAHNTSLLQVTEIRTFLRAVLVLFNLTSNQDYGEKRERKRWERGRETEKTMAFECYIIFQSNPRLS